MVDSVVKTRLYIIWSGMKQRCYNEKHHQYKNYGGRGIAVCDEWRNNFYAFSEWALSHGYHDPLETDKRGDVLSIDRIDNDKGYSPSNCQWISLSANAKKTNHLAPCKGFVRMTMRMPHKLTEFLDHEAQEKGISRNALIVSVCLDYLGGVENARN